MLVVLLLMVGLEEAEVLVLKLPGLDMEVMVVALKEHILDKAKHIMVYKILEAEVVDLITNQRKPGAAVQELY